MDAEAGARLLLRTDALFELALGLPLLTGGSTGLNDALDLPPPASGPLTTAFGGALLPVAAVLWRESERPDRRRLQVLAASNALTGTLLAGWLVRRRGQTGVAGVMTVAAAATGLVALAVAQARIAPRLR